MIAEILITIIALFAIFKSLIMLRKRKLTLFLCLFWIIFWLIAMISVNIPEISRAITVFFGRDISLILFINILLLYYFGLMLYLRISKNQDKITRLVREIALRDNKIKK